MLPEKLQGKEFQEYLTDLVKKDSKIRHVNYKNTVDHVQEMAVHAWGKKPEKLLEDFRPREEEAVRNYRLNSWESPTRSKFDKAISILNKIFNPKLYSISFPTQPAGAKIADGETLEDYTLNYYPEFDSVFMFCREVLLKQMIADPNGVIAIVPTQYDLPQNEYQKPIAVIFGSEQILDSKRGVFFLIKDKEVKKHKTKDGAIIHLFTVNSIYTFHQLFTEQGESRFIEFAKYDHNFEMLPSWYLGGIVNAEQFPYYYSSFFNPAIPHWNKAVRHDSDLDGAYVNHLHPQKWELTMDCDYSDSHGYMCNGGKIYIESKDYTTTCPRCKGTSKVSVKSPYDVYQVNPDKISSLDGKNPIIPPAGYLNVPIEIIGKLEEKVQSCINAGLEAINMDIVNSIGANQSGIAKEYDRSELHSFMQQISDYIYDNHLSNILYFINKYRYDVILGKKVDKYTPAISKPTNFDTLTTKELTYEISEAKTAKVNSNYITSLEKDAAGKRFSTNKEELNKIVAILDLDPFANFTIDEKSLMSLDGSVSKIDIVISNNIKSFIDRSVFENQDFYEKDRAEKMKILIAYANEVISSNKTSVMDLLPNDNRSISE